MAVVGGLMTNINMTAYNCSTARGLLACPLGKSHRTCEPVVHIGTTSEGGIRRGCGASALASSLNP